MSRFGRTRAILLAVVAGAGILLLAAGAASAVPAAPFAAKITTLDDVACPTSTHCWATGVAGTRGVIVASADGGVSWKVQRELASGEGAGSLVCPSAADCVVTTGLTNDHPEARSPVLLTTDGGRTWSTHRVTARDAFDINGIACPAASHCWIVAQTNETAQRPRVVIWATSDGGRSWHLQHPPGLSAAMGLSLGISCPTERDCTVVGLGATMTTSDGGTRWHRYATALGGFNVVACPTTTECIGETDVTSAVPANEQASISRSTDGGHKWRVVVKKVGGRVTGLWAVSCPTTSDCVSVGGGYTPKGSSSTPWGASETSTDGGRTWHGTQVRAVAALFGLSCAPHAELCLATGVNTHEGPALVRSTDRGAKWTAEAVPAG